MNRVPLFWATPEHDLVANALGYNTHNKNMRKHSEQYFDFTHEADIALSIAPGDTYQPIPGKFNVLFTMWELLDVPPPYIEALANADAVIVPCRFCKDIFSKYIDPSKIWVCFEGVDPDVYTFKERTYPDMAAGEKFRFLWVGAPNERKGYRFILEMVKVFEQVPTVEVYIKTTMPKVDWQTTLKKTWEKRKEIFMDEKRLRSLGSMIRRIPKPYMNDRVTVYGKHKNIFFDTRKVPTEELVALYHSAHGFVLPHLGEGWGLTLCEAMATGCPSVSVAETGCKDFFDESVGYTLKTDIIEQNLKENYHLEKARAYVPRASDVLKRMTELMMNYPTAQAKGRAASRRIRDKFTWPIAARRLRTIIDEINVRRESGAWQQTSRPSQEIISI